MLRRVYLKQTECIYAARQSWRNHYDAEHGKAIGQIVPVKPTVEERIQAMVDAGPAEWNGQKLKAYEPKAIINWGAGQLSTRKSGESSCQSRRCR